MAIRRNDAAILGFVFALLGLISFGLVAVPAIILCILGLRRKAYRKLAWIGLVISSIECCILFGLIFLFTPPGSIPYPLNRLKYRLASNSGFWLDYDEAHIVKVQSRKFFSLHSEGKIHFKTEEQGGYKAEHVISYAEKNGWVYGGKIHLTDEDFSRYYSKQKFDDPNVWVTILEIDGLISPPLWIQSSCAVLGFDTGNLHGSPSYVMILDGGSEMVVYTNNHFAPEPAYPFRLPPLFYEKVQ
jgi:hypothetical protein